MCAILKKVKQVAKNNLWIKIETMRGKNLSIELLFSCVRFRINNLRQR